MCTCGDSVGSIFVDEGVRRHASCVGSVPSREHSEAPFVNLIPNSSPSTGPTVSGPSVPSGVGWISGNVKLVYDNNDGVQDNVSMLCAICVFGPMAKDWGAR